MGKSKDGKLSVDFGEGDTKIKVRFSSQAQAQRCDVLMSYCSRLFNQGVAPENIRATFEADIDKCMEILDKIQAKHEGVKRMAQAAGDEQTV